MADAPVTRIWIGRSIFVVIALVLIFAQLLPLDTRPHIWTVSSGWFAATLIWISPEWLLAATLVWVSRRPEYSPVLVIALVFFLADLLFQRPPGLWAGLVVILSEMIRKRSKGIRNMPFALEWGTVSLGIVAITLVNRAVLIVVMTERPPFGITLIQMVMTIIFFPLVVAVAHFLFRVSRPALGQVDNRGHRL